MSSIVKSVLDPICYHFKLDSENAKLGALCFSLGSIFVITGKLLVGTAQKVYACYVRNNNPHLKFSYETEENLSACAKMITRSVESLVKDIYTLTKEKKKLENTLEETKKQLEATQANLKNRQTETSNLEQFIENSKKDLNHYEQKLNEYQQQYPDSIDLTPNPDFDKVTKSTPTTNQTSSLHLTATQNLPITTTETSSLNSYSPSQKVKHKIQIMENLVRDQALFMQKFAQIGKTQLNEIKTEISKLKEEIESSQKKLTQIKEEIEKINVTIKELEDKINNTQSAQKLKDIGTLIDLKQKEIDYLRERSIQEIILHHQVGWHSEDNDATYKELCKKLLEQDIKLFQDRDPESSDTTSEISLDPQSDNDDENAIQEEPVQPPAPVDNNQPPAPVDNNQPPAPVDNTND